METKIFKANMAFIEHVAGFGMVVGNDGEDVAVPVSKIADFVAHGFIGDADPLDHDHDGEPGGSEPHVPPALTGKNKAELLAIAAEEGVTVEDGAKNADIVAAIELAREAKAAEAAAAATGADESAP